MTGAKTLCVRTRPWAMGRECGIHVHESCGILRSSCIQLTHTVASDGSTEMSSMASSKYQALKVKSFNADAPVFAPAKELSKTAPVFEPACGDKTWHERTYSDAATEVSQESGEFTESCASDSDDWLA